MKNRIVLTGATGLIGSKLVKILENNYELIIFSRNPERAQAQLGNAHTYVEWDVTKPDYWKMYLEGTKAVIHLAGENIVAGRWTELQKSKIYNSRVGSTLSLVREISKLKAKPEQFIAASAVGFYGYSDTKIFSESDEQAEGYLPGLVSEWEKASLSLANFGVSRTVLRIGVVLDQKNGALSKFITPFKLFIGGPLGKGSQWFPWIHIDDLVGIVEYLLTNKVDGIFNAVAPDVIDMNGFTQQLGKAMNRPSFFKVPEFILKLILGEASEVVLKGANVSAEKILKTGFKFKFGKLNEALQDLMKS